MNTYLAHLALLLVGLTYAGNYLVAKGLMPDLIGPSGFIVLRVLGGGGLVWLLRGALRVGGKPWDRIDASDWWRLFACGTTGVAANQLLFFNGLNATSPVNASLIMTSNPILVLGISSILLGTAITSRKVLGIGLGAIGAITLMVIGGQSEGAYSSWQGDLMILLNATSYGFYLVLVKPLMSKYRPLTVISWVFAFGALWVLPIGMKQALAVDWNAFEMADWQGLAYVVLGTTFMVYLLNIYALRMVQPTVVSIYIYLQPILTTAFSFLLVSSGGRDYTSDLGWYTVLCASAIFLGVALVSLPGRSAS